MGCGDARRSIAACYHVCMCVCPNTTPVSHRPLSTPASSLSRTRCPVTSICAAHRLCARVQRVFPEHIVCVCVCAIVHVMRVSVLGIAPD